MKKVVPFDLPKDSRVSLIVYNVRGQVVARLVEGPLGASTYIYSFAADRLSAGIYYYVLTADEFKATKKMVLQSDGQLHITSSTALTG